MSRQRQQSARVSWQEQNKEARAEFLEANSWQRETIETKVDSQDGFLVLIGLFVVLVLENLWQFDADVFASSMRLEVFLALLVCGAACGVFAIFSMTMIRLKLQQLVARDIAALRSLQVCKNTKLYCSGGVRLLFVGAILVAPQPDLTHASMWNILTCPRDAPMRAIELK